LWDAIAKHARVGTFDSLRKIQIAPVGKGGATSQEGKGKEQGEQL
jgi:hypothetical protein